VLKKRDTYREEYTVVQHFGGRLVFLHVLELPPAHAVGYGPEMGAFLLMPLISPQEIEPEWQVFFADLPALVDVNYERSTSEGQAVSAIGETAENIKLT
jgi:hypothetical protein